MNTHSESRPAVAHRAATAGATLANESFRTDLAVETKSGPTDFVTEADRAAQRRVIEGIENVYPDEPIVGEEDDARTVVPDEGPAWIVDPIDGEPVGAAVVLPALGDSYTADGTAAFRNGKQIAVSNTTEPALATVSPMLWWPADDRVAYAAATRAVVSRCDDLRRIGSAQATLSLVADGGLDGALTDRSANPWDTVAGVHLVRCAGGRVTDREGNRWRFDSPGLVVSNGRIHDELLAVADEIVESR